MIQPAPFSLRCQVGKPETYFIHDGYEVRLENNWFDDRPFTDEYQKEVYEYARRVADENKLSSVCDIGCGSGFKLVSNFFGFEKVTGIDTADTIAFCQKKWPTGCGYQEWLHWFVCDDFDLDPVAIRPNDLIIAADVIEHLPDPNRLLECIRKLEPRRIVLSTPERDELGLGTHNGPPRNIHHVREWNFAEFHAYTGSWFKIREHFVYGGTQCVECEP